MFSSQAQPASRSIFCIDVLILILEVLQYGEWSLLGELDDPELVRLANKLPETLLRSRADSSVKKYVGAIKRWKMWAISHQLPTFPAQAHYVALYLQHLAERAKSKSAVEEAVNALAWMHSLAGVNSPHRQLNGTRNSARLEEIPSQASS